MGDPAKNAKMTTEQKQPLPKSPLYGKTLMPNVKGQPMIALNPQTEQQLQELAAQTRQTVQQLIDSFIRDFQEEQLSVRRADESYAHYLNSSESFSLQQIKQANDLAS